MIYPGALSKDLMKKNFKKYRDRVSSTGELPGDVPSEDLVGKEKKLEKKRSQPGMAPVQLTRGHNLSGTWVGKNYFSKKKFRPRVQYTFHLPGDTFSWYLVNFFIFFSPAG